MFGDVAAAVFVGTSVVTFAIMLYVGGLVASSITFGLVRINNKPMMEDPVAKQVALKTMFVQPAVSAILVLASIGILGSM